MSSTATAAPEGDFESPACKDVYEEARELEEFRVCSVVLYLGHADVALRFMNLYEERYRVRQRGLWESLRVRVLFRLGRVQDAEALAHKWKGTEVGREIAQQIRFERESVDNGRPPQSPGAAGRRP